MKRSAKAAAIPAWSIGCRCFTTSSTRCSIICRQSPIVLEPLAEDAAHERFAQIAEYYEARREPLDESGGAPYKPLPPDRLYLSEKEWKKRLDRRAAGAG